MTVVRACQVCGKPGAGRCAQHPRAYDSPRYRRARRALLASARASTATRCWRCGEPARAGDPWTAGHVVDVAAGGAGGTLLPEHESCNKRAGRALQGPRR